MHEDLKNFDVLDLSETSDFAPKLEAWYKELAEASQDSTHLEDATRTFCERLGSYWKSQEKNKQIEPGSFGLNVEGVEQSANCISFNTDVETTTCKWGHEIGPNGERIPKITVFCIPYKPEKGEYGVSQSDHQYNIDLAQNNITVVRRDWKPKPGETPWETTTISFTFSPTRQQLSD